MKNKKLLLGVILLGIGMLGFYQNCSEVQAEETIHIVREASGDLEPLVAIEVSEEEASEWERAESWQNASGSASAEANQFLEYGSDYGYQDMAKRSNSVGRQYAYQQMETLCREFTVNGQDAEILSLEDNSVMIAGKIKVADYNLTKDEKIEAYFTFRNDNPQYFWLSNQVVFSDSSIMVLTYDEYADGADRLAALEEITDTAQSVYRSQITTEDRKYQKVLKIHDALIADVEYSYDTSIPTAHSIAGAMTSAKSSVCEGYAKTMQVMMNCYGIRNIYVTGEAGGGHAWNMVYMDDGKYYWLDATWDDQEQEIFQHQYFLVGNLDFADHTADQPDSTGSEFLYELPQASDESYVYDPDAVYIVKGDINADSSVNLLDLMKCLNHVSKKSELTGDAFTAADINGDGKVDLLDLMRILNYVSKKTSEL